MRGNLRELAIAIAGRQYAKEKECGQESEGIRRDIWRSEDEDESSRMEELELDDGEGVVVEVEAEVSFQNFGLSIGKAPARVRAAAVVDGELERAQSCSWEHAAGRGDMEGTWTSGGGWHRLQQALACCKSRSEPDRFAPESLWLRHHPSALSAAPPYNFVQLQHRGDSTSAFPPG